MDSKFGEYLGHEMRVSDVRFTNKVWGRFEAKLIVKLNRKDPKAIHLDTVNYIRNKEGHDTHLMIHPLGYGYVGVPSLNLYGYDLKYLKYSHMLLKEIAGEFYSTQWFDKFFNEFLKDDSTVFKPLIKFIP